MSQLKPTKRTITVSIKLKPPEGLPATAKQVSVSLHAPSVIFQSKAIRLSGPRSLRLDPNQKSCVVVLEAACDIKQYLHVFVAIQDDEGAAAAWSESRYMAHRTVEIEPGDTDLDMFMIIGDFELYSLHGPICRAA